MPGLIRGVARTAVVAGTATAVGGRVNRRQQKKWAAQGQPPAEPQDAEPPQVVYAVPPAVVPVAEPAPDRMAQLKDLGELHAQGVLTDEEFASEKAKILNS
jgi:hypothetical protein